MGDESPDAATMWLGGQVFGFIYAGPDVSGGVDD
jgi:hypothetical protein